MHNWEVKKVGDISESCLGKMLDKAKNKGTFHPYLSNKCVRWGGFDFNYISEMRFEPHEDKRFGLEYGDLVICEGGEPGRCAIWKNEISNMKIQKALHRVRVKSGYSNEFLFYQFLLAGKTGSIEKHFIGSTIKHLTGVGLKQIEFTFPHFKIQQNIAKVLSDLDSKIELNNKINAELGGMAKLIYEYWFVQFDFPISAEQAEQLGDPTLAGKPYKSSGGKMVWNKELKREIPEGWESGNIMKLANFYGGGTPKTNVASYWNGGIPFFTPADTEGSIYSIETKETLTLEGLNSCSSKLFPKNTIFITARGSVGKVNIASRDMAMNQSCYAISGKDGVSSYFTYFYTLELVQKIKAKASGSIFNALVTNDFKFTELTVPSRDVIRNFTCVTESSFAKILNNKIQNQQLSSLRDWLLPMLMNGQVRVVDENLNSEEKLRRAVDESERH